MAAVTLDGTCDATSATLPDANLDRTVPLSGTAAARGLARRFNYPSPALTVAPGPPVEGGFAE